MPRIDGTDALSRDALALLEQGRSLADVQALGLTQDQAKKLGRLSGIQQRARDQLTAGALAKLQALGLKALALAHLVQAEDWPGLEEILQTVDPSSVKREELERAPALLAEKRARVAEIEQQMTVRLEYLERQRQQMKEEAAVQRPRPPGQWRSPGRHRTAPAAPAPSGHGRGTSWGRTALSRQWLPGLIPTEIGVDHLPDGTADRPQRRLSPNPAELFQPPCEVVVSGPRSWGRRSAADTRNIATCSSLPIAPESPPAAAARTGCAAGDAPSRSLARPKTPRTPG